MTDQFEYAQIAVSAFVTWYLTSRFYIDRGNRSRPRKR